ncbi:MAG: ABC transporter substrate-binding protein [Solirubrobacteraceae bacterium]|nr:ABC transporter substrate-binding protein [Solirubrobacteraceae bacterium]
MRRSLTQAAATLSLTAALGLAVSGCGGGDDDDAGSAAAKAPPKVHWTLVLDYQPNAVHAGIVRALRAGYFDDAGIDLKIVAPASTSDALTQVGRGKAEVGLADLIDVARRNERADGATDGSGGVSLVGAVVQEPLSGILVSAKSPIKVPADLAGKRIAVTGLPSDVAVVDAIARRDGKPVKTKQITLGFDGLKALDAGRVDGATAYWPADEVTLKGLGTPPRTFSLSKDGGVHYPGLVAFTTPAIAKEQPEAVKAFAGALEHGTRDVIADPSLGEDAIGLEYPELDAAATKAQLANYVPLFGTDATAGRIDDAALTRFATFAAGSGLTKGVLTPAELRGTPAG